MQIIDNEKSIISISNTSKDIVVIDTNGSTGSICECGREAMFRVLVYKHQFELCEKCIGELGKCIIDGLI